MKEVSVNILVHERAEFLDMTVWSLRQLTKETKERIKVKLLVSHDNRNIGGGTSIKMAESAGYRLMESGIDVHVRVFTRLPPYNFMDKMRWMVNEPEPYIIRVDDDCFASPAAWEQLIGSDHLLKEPRNNNVLAIAPCVTNGIPTFEWWVKTFCNFNEGKRLFEMCMDNPCISKWGIDYPTLKPIYEQKFWNPDAYYKACYDSDEERLGIHPMRFNLDIQKEINRIVLENWEKFISTPTAYTERQVFPQHRPYFCNTCFMIRKRDYHAIVQNRQLARDSFEELTFNNYRRMHSKELIFLTNAWMLNFYYRVVGNLNLERELYQQIKSKLT